MAISVSNPIGFESELAKPISIFGGFKKKRDCFLSLVMTRRWCRFAPSSDNAEDRELEGVPNVMELYTLFPNPFLFAIIYSIFGEQRS